MTVSDLAACLRQEIELAAGIVHTLDEQQQALLRLDLTGLEASVPVLEELIDEFRKAEERREATARALAQEHELDGAAPLRGLLVFLPVPVGRELEQAGRRLGSLIEDIRHRNHANHVLMLNAARFNRAILQFVAGTAATYAQDGVRGEAGEARPLIFNKEA